LGSSLELKRERVGHLFGAGLLWARANRLSTFLSFHSKAVTIVEAMLQVVLHNTFVDTIDNEGCQTRLLALPRSKSAELPSLRRSPSDDKAIAAAAESQQVVRLNTLPGFCPDVRASSADAARTCHASGEDTSRRAMFEGGEATHDEARPPRATQDGDNVLRSKTLPRRDGLEGREVLCGNAQEGGRWDAVAAWDGGKAAANSSEKECAIICELRELQQQLRVACSRPRAARGKLGHHTWSSSSVSTMAPDVGSDFEAEMPNAEASIGRIPKVFSSGSVNSMAPTTASLDSPLINAGMKHAWSSGSVNTLASIEDFDALDEPDPEPRQFEFEMSIDEYDVRDEGTFQQATSPVHVPKSWPSGWAGSPSLRPAIAAPFALKGATAAAAAASLARPPLPPPPGVWAPTSPKQAPQYLNLVQELW